MLSQGVIRPLTPDEVPRALYSPLGLAVKEGSDKIRLTFHHTFMVLLPVSVPKICYSLSDLGRFAP